MLSNFSEINLINNQLLSQFIYSQDENQIQLEKQKQF